MATPTNDTREQIIRRYQDALNALADVVDLAESDPSGRLGMSEWFCDGYPFGGDLGEFVYEFANYLNKLKGN
jgi:hypothetical protein